MGFFLLSPKSLTCYRLGILPLLPPFLQRFNGKSWWLIGLFCLYSTAVGIYWTFWEDWSGGGSYNSFLMQALGSPLQMRHLSFIGLLDLVIVGSEVVWLLLCFRRTALPRHAQTGAPSLESQSPGVLVGSQ
jgi:hypothetical protein